MSGPETSRLDLTHVLEHFPHSAALVRRLVVVDDTFWSICEDYALARATLVKLEKLEQAEQNVTKLADYRALVADLEREIAEALRNAK
jgi:hypothetical protein